MYTNKYIKTKINLYSGKVNTNFHGNKIPAYGGRCACLFVSIVKVVKIILSRNTFRRMQI